MSGANDAPYFGEYPSDFFDFIIIDECHRGGANDEGNWRGILSILIPQYNLVSLLRQSGRIMWTPTSTLVSRSISTHSRKA